MWMKWMNEWMQSSKWDFRCEIRNLRSQREGGKLTRQHLSDFFSMLYYGTRCWGALLCCLSACSWINLFSLHNFWRTKKMRALFFEFNFRFHLSKVSDACAKKLNYTVCKWHNGEFYYTHATWMCSSWHSVPLSVRSNHSFSPVQGSFFIVLCNDSEAGTKAL